MGKIIKKFKTREEAYWKTLEDIRGEMLEGAVVLSLSPEGDFYGRKLANQFNLPFDRLIIERLYSHINPETILGAISETRDYILIEELVESFQLSEDYLFSQLEKSYGEKILTKIRNWRGHPLQLQNKKVVLVDEASETGLRAMTGIKSCYNAGVENISLFLSLLSVESRELMEHLVDNLYYGMVIEDFITGYHYFEEEGEEMEQWKNGDRNLLKLLQ
jgi:putative phosphoribosyl transferase